MQAGITKYDAYDCQLNTLIFEGVIFKFQHAIDLLRITKQQLENPHYAFTSL